MNEEKRFKRLEEMQKGRQTRHVSKHKAGYELFMKESTGLERLKKTMWVQLSP